VRTRTRRRVLIAAVIAILIGAGSAAVAQILQKTNAKAVEQVSALTVSTAATYSTPSGAFEAMPQTSLRFDLKQRSLLIVAFSARGVSAQNPGQTTIPIVFVKCEIDGVACQPNSNPVEFLYPLFCCDTRSFTWVVHNALTGPHKVSIRWGMGNPGSAVVTNRSLVVLAARL
jgi:hypothetical protein